MRKCFGFHSADPSSVSRDIVSLDLALDTIAAHLADCCSRARAGLFITMRSIEPSMEVIHYLRIKHRMGRKFGDYWKEALRADTLEGKYLQAQREMMRFHEANVIARRDGKNRRRARVRRRYAKENPRPRGFKRGHMELRRLEKDQTLPRALFYERKCTKLASERETVPGSHNLKVRPPLSGKTQPSKGNSSSRKGIQGRRSRHTPSQGNYGTGLIRVSVRDDSGKSPSETFPGDCTGKGHDETSLSIYPGKDDFPKKFKSLGENVSHRTSIGVEATKEGKKRPLRRRNIVGKKKSHMEDTKQGKSDDMIQGAGKEPGRLLMPRGYGNRAQEESSLNAAQHHGRAGVAAPVGAGTSPWRILCDFVSYTYTSFMRRTFFGERNHPRKENWPIDPIDVKRVNVEELLLLKTGSDVREEKKIFGFVQDANKFKGLLRKDYDPRYRGESKRLEPFVEGDGEVRGNKENPTENRKNMDDSIFDSQAEEENHACDLECDSSQRDTIYSPRPFNVSELAGY